MTATASPPPRRRRLRPEQRRELIVAAAADEFGRRGFQEARLSDIAEAAGTTKAVIYDHFANKQALREEVLAFTIREWAEAVGAAIAGVDEPLERLRVGFEAYFRFCDERPYARLLLFRDPTAGSDVAKAQSRAQSFAADGAAAVYLAEPTFLAGHPQRERRAREVAHAVIGACNAIAGAPRLSVQRRTELAMDLLSPGLEAMRGVSRSSASPSASS
jgi:AcrR family transcriptional regulator